MNKERQPESPATLAALTRIGRQLAGEGLGPESPQEVAGQLFGMGMAAEAGYGGAMGGLVEAAKLAAGKIEKGEKTRGNPELVLAACEVLGLLAQLPASAQLQSHMAKLSQAAGVPRVADLVELTRLRYQTRLDLAKVHPAVRTVLEGIAVKQRVSDLWLAGRMDGAVNVKLLLAVAGDIRAYSSRHLEPGQGGDEEEKSS